MYGLHDQERPAEKARARRIQRAAATLHERVLGWASGVMAILPKGLPLTADDAELLKLFLAQQRRLNLELDGRNGHNRFLAIVRYLPLLKDDAPGASIQAAHKLAYSFLQHAIEDTAERFCGQHGLSPACDAAIDWRVSIRYLAQQLHRIACQMNLRNDLHPASPLKFDLTLVARELANNVALKRAQLLGTARKGLPLPDLYFRPPSGP